MAASTLKVKTSQGYGTSLTAKAYTRDTDTLAANGTSGASVEGTNQKGNYTFTITDLATGVYDLRIVNSSDLTVASGLLNHVNAVGVEYPYLDLTGTTVGLTAAAIQAIWDKATSALTTVGSIGKWIIDKLDAAVSSISSVSVGTVTIPAAAAVNAVDRSAVTVYRGTTWTIALTDLGDLTGWTKIYFTARKNVNDEDSKSLTQVMVTNPASGANDGLQYFDGVAASDKTKGSITVVDLDDGDITIVVDISVTKCDAQKIVYDVKVLDADGGHLMSIGATFTVVADVTRAIT
jgi:hypothetical protein